MRPENRSGAMDTKGFPKFTEKAVPWNESVSTSSAPKNSERKRPTAGQMMAVSFLRFSWTP